MTIRQLVLHSFFLSLPILPATLSAQSTFEVNSTADAVDNNVGDGVCKTDAGTCTLRAALQEANDDNGQDTIQFSLPASTIQPSSPLPAIEQPITIDGVTGSSASCPTATQPAVLLITLSGAAVGTADTPGLLLLEDADGSVIRGLNIVSWTGPGVHLKGNDRGILSDDYLEDVDVVCNQIGTNNSDSPAFGNKEGILATGILNLEVGGTVHSDRNVVSGNDVAGIRVFRSEADEESLGFTGSILRNYIGTARNGIGALPNGGNGVYVYAQGSAGTGYTMDMTVGSVDDPNTIAFNEGAGIRSFRAGSIPLTLSFRNNRIFDNEGFGVDRSPNGPPVDGFSRNPPTIVDISPTGLVTARLKSGTWPIWSYHIDVFESESCDPSNYGEGKDWVGSTFINPNLPEYEFTFQLPSIPPNGTVITMLTTNPSDDTSSFSNCAFFGEIGFTVDTRLQGDDTNPGDNICFSSGLGCTLEAALEEVNGQPGTGPFRISFDIDDWINDNRTIQGGALPPITKPVIIDGLSQLETTCPGLSGSSDTVMRLGSGFTLGSGSDGSTIQGLYILPGTGDNGVTILSDNNVLQCLVIDPIAIVNDDGIDVIGDVNTIGGGETWQTNWIRNNADAGIELSATASRNFIYGNEITSNTYGIHVVSLAGDNSIGAINKLVGGQVLPVGRNYIAGNTDAGIFMDGTGPDNKIGGNDIGARTDGSAVSGNATHGIQIETPNTIVGKTEGFQGIDYFVPNVIGDNGAAGIYVNAEDVQILGNYIGVPMTGVTPIGNVVNGIFVSGVNTLIQDNTIGNNGVHGIRLESALNDVFGNTIGFAADGTTPAGNGGTGVRVDESSNQIGLRNDDGKANVIANNSGYGVYLDVNSQYVQVENNEIFANDKDGIAVKAPAIQNAFFQNAIYGNGEFAIDLGDDDVVLQNDSGDADTGANGLMNRATILGSDPSNGDIRFVFDGVPNADYLIEFYASSSCPSVLTGEGEVPSKTHVNFTTDGDGDFSGTVSGLNHEGGAYLTALITDTFSGGIGGSTSEFSACYDVPRDQIELSAIFLLEGAYTGGVPFQSTTLNVAGALPLLQPYNALPWNYSGPESVASGFFASHPGIVDWVFLRLRTGNPLGTMTIEAERAGFLLEDGSVVDVDGSSPLLFDATSENRYWVEILHRNHLAVMSASDVSFSSGSAAYDFRAFGGSNPAYGGAAAVVDLGGTGFGPYAMFAADANADGDVQALDFNDYISQTTAGASGYQSADFNMDGNVQALDFNLYIANTTAGASSQVP